MEYKHSFWEKDAWLNTTDLIIVGGGIMGASTALFYKQKNPDHEVILVDRGVTPIGASTRNAGFTCIGSMSEHLADIEIAGMPTVINRIERRWNGLNLLRSIMGEGNIGYENTGGFEIFTNTILFERCIEHVEQMNKRLYNRLDEKDVYTVRSHNGYPAIFNRLEGAIHSGKLMRALHNRISKLGVRTFWNSNVISAEPGLVRFESGLEIDAKKVALTVNGFASQITGLNVKPCRGYIFVTNPIDNLQWKGTFHHNQGYVYFRNVGDQLLLGGARDVAIEEETTAQFGFNEKIRKWLMNFSDTVLKLPKGWSIDQEWSGIMGMTENKEPIIKEIKPGVFAAAGLSGMGIAIGMQVAKDLIDRMES